MNRDEFLEYCELFSTSKDKGPLFDKYYHPDAEFDHPLKGIFRGREEIVTFWMSGHKGIHEVIRHENLLVDVDSMAAELLIEWHCTEDTDYLGPKKKGEVYYAGCAAFYRLENKKIKHVRLYLREKK
jgi:hypothetical protein